MSVPPLPLALTFAHAVASLLLVTLLPFKVDACCPEEQPQPSNCSFFHHTDTFFCEVLQGSNNGYHSGRCPDYGYRILDAVPAPVVDLQVEPFITSCTPTMDNPVPLAASSCNVPCTAPGSPIYAGISVAFRVDMFSVEQLDAIEISLRRVSTPISFRVWCNQLYIGKSGISRAAAQEHVFNFRGFIGLQPNARYAVHVKTLPSPVSNINERQVTVTIPMEECWNPQLVFHDTPFAVNLTLFEDPLHNFTTFQVVVRAKKQQQSKIIEFDNAAQYNLNGKQAMDVSFGCLPRSYIDINLRIFIRTKQCPYCDWFSTQVKVNAVPPAVKNCPSNITKEVEVGGADVVRNISWVEPMFHTVCDTYAQEMNRSQSHQPLSSIFKVGTKTRVLYAAQLFGKVAECLFYVTVTAVDTIPPRITSCPTDIWLVADRGEDQLSVTWDEPGADDASPLTATSSHRSGSKFPVGQNTTVTYTVVDGYGNKAICEFHVNIEGTPEASLLVIAASCCVGIVLTLILALIIYRRMHPHKLKEGMPEEGTEYDQKLEREENNSVEEKLHFVSTCESEGISDFPAILKAHGSMSSVGSSRAPDHEIGQLKHHVATGNSFRVRSTSDPILKPSSGQYSNSDNRFPLTHSHPAAEEPLLGHWPWLLPNDRMDSMSEERSSQFTGSDIDSPNSFESTC